MYPNLYYAFKDIFGPQWTWSGLRFINTFGFFVAIAFIASAAVLTWELRRKGKGGLLTYEEEKLTVGKAVTSSELISNFILGFILGYKIIGAFVSTSPLTQNPQDFIFSLEGSWPFGIIIGLLFAGLKWNEKRKQQLPKPEIRTIRVWPHDRVGDIVILAAIFGFLGAKIFHNLENWDEFTQDPIGALTSFSGLTFYGGLICAAIAIWVYARKHKIGIWHLNDAAAPTLMLAYALGRIGCQVAGDGDWGILNSAYVSGPDGKAVLTTPQQFSATLEANASYYTSQFGSLDKVHHLGFKAPSFLPDWLVAYTYPHNVINEGVRFADCTGQYCSYLPIPVFPTPFYETMVGLLLFFLLWFLRKKIRIPGALFAVYLILNGLERFFIEKIRVNTTYKDLPFQPTQAELISLLLIITGGFLLFYLKKRTPAHKIL